MHGMRYWFAVDWAHPVGLIDLESQAQQKKSKRNKNGKRKRKEKACFQISPHPAPYDNTSTDIMLVPCVKRYHNTLYEDSGVHLCFK